jgi:hypothetical protein
MTTTMAPEPITVAGGPKQSPRHVRRKVVDKLVTVLVTGAFVMAMLPLFSILWTVI